MLTNEETNFAINETSTPTPSTSTPHVTTSSTDPNKTCEVVSKVRKQWSRLNLHRLCGITSPNLLIRKVIRKLNVLIVVKNCVLIQKNGTSSLKNHIKVCPKLKLVRDSEEKR